MHLSLSVIEAQSVVVSLTYLGQHLNSDFLGAGGVTVSDLSGAGFTVSPLSGAADCMTANPISTAINMNINAAKIACEGERIFFTILLK